MATVENINNRLYLKFYDSNRGYTRRKSLGLKYNDCNYKAAQKIALEYVDNKCNEIKQSNFSPEFFDKEITKKLINKCDFACGFLYIIKMKARNIYKVGVTNTHPNLDRIKNLQVGNPFELNLTNTFFIKEPYMIEKRIHLFFSHKRKSGEWFDLSKKDIDYLKYYLMELQTMDMINFKQMLYQLS